MVTAPFHLSEQWFPVMCGNLGTPRWPHETLELHGLTGAGVFVAAGATGCAICGG